MNEKEIRSRVQKALADAVLPRDLPKLKVPPKPGENRQLLMEAGGALNDRCVVCEEIATQIRYNLPDKPVAFHQVCHDIWKEEAVKQNNAPGIESLNS
jgi:hypothetical protein